MSRQLLKGGLVIGLGLIALAATAGRVGAAKPACRIIDRDTGSQFTTVQSAVDAAASEDTIAIKGSCVGTAVITKSVTIVGQAAGGFGAPTLDGGGNGPVLTIQPASGACSALNVRLTGITVTGANTVAAPFPHDQGGGIVNCANLSLRKVTVTGNQAWIGAGILSNGDLTLRNSTVSDNHTGPGQVGGIFAEGGGGIFAEGRGTVTLINSTVTGNTSSQGGGIYEDEAGAPIVLKGHTEITGNSALRGGGIFNRFGGFISCLDNSTITNNTGGGLWGDIGETTGLVGCVDGVNVINNTPFNIGP